MSEPKVLSDKEWEEKKRLFGVDVCLVTAKDIQDIDKTITSLREEIERLKRDRDTDSDIFKVVNNDLNVYRIKFEDTQALLSEYRETVGDVMEKEISVSVCAEMICNGRTEEAEKLMAGHSQAKANLKALHEKGKGEK